MPRSSLVTPPAVEPVTLAEVKAHLRLTTDADDDALALFIPAARQEAEAFTGRAFLEQTWALTLDTREIPTNGVRALVLPKAPLLGIDSVQTFAANDTATTLDPASYRAEVAYEPGRLALRETSSWPLPGRSTSGFVVTYRAGYGSDRASVPAALRLAVLHLVAHAYEHRGDESGAPARSAVAESLLRPFRLLGGRV